MKNFLINRALVAKKRLKLFFACLLMAVLSIGQVWAETATYTVSTASEVTETGDIPDGSSAALTGNAGLNGGMLQITYGKNAVLTLSGYAGCTITGFKMSMKSNSSKGKGSMTLVAGETTLHSVPDAAFNTNNWYGSWSTSAVDVDFTSVMTTDYTVDEDENIVITVTNHGTSNSTNSLYIGSYTITYEVSSSGGSTPSLSVTPTSWDFGDVASSDAASKVFSVSGSNLTAGTLSISVPEGFSVSPSSISVTEATLAATNVTVSKNTTAIDDYSGNLSISATCGLTEAKTVALEMSVVADPEPTGTFELFSGDIEEGDYVIVSANALSNTVNTNRIASQAVTVSDNKIVNPDAAIVWHIEANGDYWTLYNAEAEKYAGGTSTKNQGALLASVTDYAKWTITGSSTYEFENLGRATGSSDTGNKWLRYNSGNAENSRWACYSTSTGSALTLYKKQVAGQPATPTFSVAGGNYESAQSVEISCETQGAKIYYTLDGSKPSSTSTEYSTAIPVSATTTIKAVAIKDDIESTVASATYTIVVWQTVDEIWSSITSEGPTNANVWGYVSQENVGGYNNNYYISVDGSLTANQLEIYKGDNAGYTVAVGDKVHVNGDLTIYGETKEFKQNTGVIVHYAAKGDLQSIAVSGTPTKTEYAANEDFDPAGLVVTGTYANGYVGVITEGITWGNDLTDNKVTETTTVHVTATVSEVASPAYDVAVTVAAKTLLSIAVDVDSYTIYTGEALPQPNVTATYSEGDPENVNAFAVYDSENVFNTATIDDPDPQTITVSYTFGGATQTATYTVSVQDYENADNAPYSVTEALHIITAAIGNTESAREIVVTGTVSAEKVSNYKNRYKISDGVNELLVYNGKGFNSEDFTDTNYPKVNDVVIVKGKVINYSNNTPEFVSAKSYLLSQIRPSTLAIEDVASFEVGTADITENDLVITTPSDGDITFVSGDDAVATIEANAIHAVAPGTVTITANLAATENVDALNYAATSTTFSVTVVAPATKYAITFDGNGADGGFAPDAIADKAAGAEVTLPANSYTKTSKVFNGWKVINNTTTEEVTVTAGAFTMPASAVTIQAQWTDAPYWSTVYDNNVTVTQNGSGATGTITIGTDDPYTLVKAGASSNTGTIVVTVPYGTTDLHFHAFAWGGKTAKIQISGVTNPSISEFDLEGEAGASGSGNDFTLQGNPVDQYFHVSFDAVAAETEITFSKATGSADNRFFFYGVNQEGGVVPVLKSIAISGDLDKKSYKAGQSLDMTGLEVSATYQLGEETPYNVDITNAAELELTYDPLVENQTSVTITATYKGQTDDITINDLVVTSADPKIYVDPSLTVNFGSVEVGEDVPANKTITITLTNVAAATATLGGTNPEAFSIDKTALVDGDVITISVIANTDAAASYAATLTISDGEGGADDKVVNLSFTVNEPVTPEDPEVRKTWDLSIASYDANPTEEQVTWSATYVNMVADKANSTTAANNYLGGDANNRTSSRFYKNSTLTITPNGKEITSIVFTATSTSYATALQGSGWTNASASVDGTTVTVTPTDGKNAIIAVVGGTCGFTSVQVNYKNIAPEPPVEDWVEVRTGLSAGNYYTVCLEKNITAIDGATFWNLQYKNSASTEVYLESVDAPEAGKPYIIQATAATLKVVYGAGEASDPVENGALRGTFSGYDADAFAALSGEIYLLIQNAIRPRTTGNFLAAHRAYIDYDELQDGTPQAAPGKKVKSMPMHKDTATGINAINASDKPVKMIIDGQLFIIRGEKMYNANGQLVK